jgi:hypothetical protein
MRIPATILCSIMMLCGCQKPTGTNAASHAGVRVGDVATVATELPSEHAKTEPRSTPAPSEAHSKDPLAHNEAHPQAASPHAEAHAESHAEHAAAAAPRSGGKFSGEYWVKGTFNYALHCPVDGDKVAIRNDQLAFSVTSAPSTRIAVSAQVKADGSFNQSTPVSADNRSRTPSTSGQRRNGKSKAGGDGDVGVGGATSVILTGKLWRQDDADGLLGEVKVMAGGKVACTFDVEATNFSWTGNFCSHQEGSMCTSDDQCCSKQCVGGGGGRQGHCAGD